MSGRTSNRTNSVNANNANEATNVLPQNLAELEAAKIAKAKADEIELQELRERESTAIAFEAKEKVRTGANLEQKSAVQGTYKSESLKAKILELPINAGRIKGTAWNHKGTLSATLVQNVGKKSFGINILEMKVQQGQSVLRKYRFNLETPNNEKISISGTLNLIVTFTPENCQPKTFGLGKFLYKVGLDALLLKKDKEAEIWSNNPFNDLLQSRLFEMLAEANAYQYEAIEVTETNGTTLEA